MADALASSLRRPFDYTTPPTDDPVATSLRRPFVVAPEARDAAVRDASSQADQGLRQGLYGLGAAAPILAGAGANLVSPGAGDSLIQSGIGLQRRGAEQGPDVQSFADAQRTGRYGDYAAGALGRAIPDVALALAGGGIGGAAVKGLARRAALDAAEEFAARQAARTGAESVSRAAVDRAASRLVPAAEAAAEPAVAAGRAAGTVAGQYPSVVAGSAEGAPDAEGRLVGGLEGADREATAKILSGDLGAAALGALPEVRLLGRIGGGAAQEAIQRGTQAFLPRVAREAATQGALGAGLGAAQTAAQFAAHKWVNDNVDLMSPSAFQSYLDSALAGGVLGAGLGGAVEGGAALSGLPARLSSDGTPNPQFDRLKTTIRDNLAKFAKARDDAFAKARSAFANREGQPTEGAPVEEPPARTATEAAQDFGNKVGEGAAKVHQTAVDMFTKLSNALSTEEGRAATTGAFADAVDSLKDRFNVAPLQAGLEAAFKSYTDALNRAKTPEAQADVQKAYGKVFEDHITDQAPDAASTFADNIERLNDTAALDDRAGSTIDQMSQRFESGDANPELEVQKRVTGLATPLQNLIAGTLPVDSPLRLNPRAMRDAASAAEKWLLGKSGDMTPHDFDALQWVNTVHPDLAAQWEAVGPRFAELQKGVEPQAERESNARPDNPSMADALQRAIDERRASREQQRAVSDTSGEAPEPGEGGDFIPGVRETTAADMPTGTLTDRLAQAKVGSDEHAALQQELRQRIINEGGDKRNGTPLTENNSGAGRAFWASKDPLHHANTIGVGTTDVKLRDGRTIQRRQALQLDNLISRKLREEPGVHDVTGDRAPVSALKAVLSDIQQAGFTVDPETITPGRFYTSREGVEYRLTAGEARVIRESLRGNDKTTISDAAREVGAQRQARADAKRTARAEAAAKEASSSVDQLARGKARVPLDKRQEVEEVTGSNDNRVAGPELTARHAPPPDQSGIADVKHTGPYDDILNAARKARAEAKTPRERAQIAHDAGVRIGRAELEKERAAGASERRLAARMRELEDPSTGLARQYLDRAARGDFDTFSTREHAPENAEPTDKNELRQQVNAAVDRAYERATGEDVPRGSFDRREAIAAKVEELSAKPELSPKERTFLSAARDVGFAKAAEGGKAPKVPSPRSGVTERAGPESERTKVTAKPEERVPGNVNPKKGQQERGRAALREKERAQIERLSDEPGIEHIDLESFYDDAGNDTRPARETEVANALLRRMDIKDLVNVTELPRSEAGKKAGDYQPGSGEIRLNGSLSNARRVETFAHELGHHIIRSELARVMGVKLADIAHFSEREIFDRMAEHQPELHAAIVKDYEAWLEKNTDPSSRYFDALASRKAAHSADYYSAAGEKNPVSVLDVSRNDPRAASYLANFEEYVADHISRALTHNEKSPVAKFFKGIADKLKLLYDTLFGGKGGEKYAPAPSVEKWVQSLFDRTTLDVSQALGESVPAETARTATAAALHAAVAARPPAGAPPANGGGGSGAGASLPPKGLKALVQFVKYRLPADSRQVLDSVLSRGKAIRALDAAYADQPDALKAMRDPDEQIEHRIAYAILAAREGKLSLGPGATSILRNLSDDLLSIANLSGKGAYAERIFNDIENGRIESMLKAGKTYDVAAREAAYRGTAQHVLNQATKTYGAVRAPLAKVFNSSIARMRDTGVPAIRRVGALLQRHTGEAGEDPGLTPAVTHVTDRLMRSAGRIFEGLSERETLHVLTALQRQSTDSHYNPKVATAVQRTRALFDELHTYGREAGLPIGRRENYFPVVLDLKTDADRAKLTSLLSQPKFEAAIRSALGSPDKPAKGPIDGLIQRMVGDGIGTAGSGTGEFRAKNFRLMHFIYTLGDDADKTTFAALQSKSPADIFSRYVQPLVREAEFARRFGADGSRLEAMLTEAKRQGATDDQLAQARAAVDGAMGRVGLDGSPVLGKLLGKPLADRLTGSGSRKAIQYGQAYQNARLLPLSLLSSLVDPMGIAVRTGGDFRTAWDGFKTGMKSLVDKQTREELQGMLRSLGSADDFLASDILASNFGRGEGGARAVNDFIFKANGLAGWTKTTRFMALQAAHGFLAKHADGKTPTSKRYLDELGLRPGDVQIENGRAKVLEPAARELASPAEQARDERVRNALLRFVDESILRPTSQQAPNWYADPYVGLVTQYKHFAYAIADQIGARIAHEVRHGNASVLVPAMSYLPIIIASEMLRGAIQYGPDGNPNRKDWGPEEYTTYALDRSGLLGPKLSFQADAAGDAKRGNLPGTSFLGPTAQQAITVARGRGDIESALPGEALYRHWNDGEANDQRAAAR